MWEAALQACSRSWPGKISLPCSAPHLRATSGCLQLSTWARAFQFGRYLCDLFPKLCNAWIEFLSHGEDAKDLVVVET